MSDANVRPLTAGDLPLILAWRNHADVRRFMFTQHEISLAEHTRWFESASRDARRHLLIFESKAVPLGFISFHQTGQGRVADWGFYLSPVAPKGTGRQLGHAALQYGFERLGLHKVCGQVLRFNERSVGFHAAIGFRQEGVLREQHFDGENYHDVICFGILASDRDVNLKSMENVDKT